MDEESINYLPAVLSNGTGFITPFLSGSIPSTLVREMIVNTIWSILCIGTFTTGIMALCFILSKKYETPGTISSIPIGYLGQSIFPLGAIWYESFKFPTFGTEYISQILSEYLFLHLLAGIVIWVVVHVIYSS